MKKCGLCGEEIKDGKYFTIYQIKVSRGELGDINDRKK